MGFRHIRVQAMVAGLILVAVLSCAIGALVLGRMGDLSEAAQERQRIENADLAERLAAERPARLAWAYGWRAVILAGAGSLVFVALVWGLRRAATIGANDRGLYPLIRLKIGRAQVLHDPNRALTATTIYTTPELAESVTVVPVLTAGQEGEQAQVTGRAQAVQALAAIASGEGDKDKGELAGAVLGATQQLTTKPLPQVERAPWEPSHIERLLIESGAVEEGDYG